MLYQTDLKLPSAAMGNSISRPQTVGEYLDSMPMNGRHWLIFLVSALGFAFDALDLQVLGLAIPFISKEWSLAPNSIGWLFSLTAFGMLIGSFVFGRLSDTIGRRTSMQLTIAIFTTGTGLCYFAQTPEQLGILRVLTGFGIGGFIPVDTAIMAEYMPARRRGLLIGLWNLFFSIGYVASAKIASILVPHFGWRSLFLLGVLPAVLVLFVRLFVPESPRFLLAKGRTTEARNSVAWLSGVKKLPADVDALFNKPVADLRGEKVVLAELFGGAYRSRMAFTWTLWFSLMFCYLGLLPWMPTLIGKFRGIPMPEVFDFLIAFSASGILGRLLVAVSIDRLGRRTLLIPFAAAALVSALGFGQQAELRGIWIWGCALGFFLDGLLGATATVTPELFPTRVRTTGIGSAQAMGRLGAILAPLAIGALAPHGVQWVFNMFAVALACVLAAAVLFRMETRQLSLEAASKDPTIS